MDVAHGIGPAGTPVALKVAADGTLASSASATVDVSTLATSAKQDTGNTSLGTAVASLASILAKILTAPATEAKQDTGNTSLASILAKLIAAPATEASLASVLAKLIAAPSTEAKQDTQITSLASILAKIIAAPATEAKQDTGNTSLGSLVTLGGGTGKAIIRGGVKGATSAADVTSTANGVDHQGVDTTEQYAPGYEDNTNGAALTIERPVATSTYAPSLATNFGTVTKANVKGSAGNVLGFVVSNQNAAVRYFLLHNKATAPAATEAPLYAFAVQPGQTLLVGINFFRGSGGAFATGVGWSIGTTSATFTDSATAAEHAVAIHYK